jgi:2-C-methyl-D-erythritol 4-phosphate cytidylyltransferase
MTLPVFFSSGAGASTRVGVVVLAAGQGTRLGGPVPKQCLMLGDRPLFAWSLRLFDQMPEVTEVALVTPREGLPDGMDAWLKGLRVPTRLVAGGRRRQDSVAAGLEALTLPCDVALTHDAARPFAPLHAVQRLARETATHGGGLLATRATDTVKLATGDGMVAQTLDRRRVWLAQTPQAIRADLLERAIEALRRPDVDVTDEASLLESWGVPVALVEAPASNFKITTAEDMARAEAWIRHPIAPG